MAIGRVGLKKKQFYRIYSIARAEAFGHYRYEGCWYAEISSDLGASLNVSHGHIRNAPRALKSSVADKVPKNNKFIGSTKKLN